MADLMLPAQLIEQLDSIARREQRSVQSLIEAWLKEHSTPNPDLPATDNPEEREEQLKEDRLRLYKIARRYWRSIGDPRQDMSDDQLENEFWLFDQDGIPRLKSEQGTVSITESPLQSILDAVALDTSLWSFGDTARHLSERSREILRHEFADYLLARMKRPAPPREE